MKKTISFLFLLVFFSISLCSSVFAAEEYNMVQYDYTTGEKSSMYISENISYPAVSLPPDDMDISTFSIIGTDERSRVDPDTIPYKSILCLRMGFDLDDDDVIDTWTVGTGAMVYYNVFLTCAHNMYWYDYGKAAKEMRIYVKQNNESFGETYYYPKNWKLPREYEDSGNIDYDWCVVKTQDLIGFGTDWFGYGWAASITEKNISVSGYPDIEGKRYFQYQGSGTMNSISDYRFEHNVDTEGGQSGAPVYDSDRIIWGVHTSGAGGSGLNSGCLVTERVYNTIDEMKINN